MSTTDGAYQAVFVFLAELFGAGLVSIVLYRLIRTKSASPPRARRYCAHAVAWSWFVYSASFLNHRTADALTSAAVAPLLFGGIAYGVGALLDRREARSQPDA